MPRRSKSIPAMWLTCLIRRKQPSLSKRLPPLRPSCVPSAEPALDSASADPDADIGGGPDESTMNDHIIIEGHDGAFAAYIARPRTSPAPAVVVLQELFGVNADIRKTCDELAEQGFLAVAPDLFWRQEPGVDLSVTSEADWQHGLRLYQAYDRDAGARDVKETIDVAAKLPDCTGKVAVLGYCLGALMTFLTIVRYGADAAVAYHGGDTVKYLGELDGLHTPLLMH